MKRLNKILLLLMATCLIAGCGQSNHRPPSSLKEYVVKPITLHKILHFTGTLQPLHETTIISPMDATVKSMRYQYGQAVRAGKPIFILNSPELEKQFNDTVTEFLKAKDTYTVTKVKFSGTQELWESGLISKNNYISEKSSLNNARISLMQASRKLSEMLEKMGVGTYRDIANLSFADFEQVKRTLAGDHNLIAIKAPANGILLYPPKASEDKANRITVGSAVKSGQVLGLIGDLSGVSAEINVPEVDIAKIKPGMAATVRGIAFAKQVLTGRLVTVNAQASTSSNALPSFTAIVEVHGLTPAQQKEIKVGMSAAIELSINSGEKLLVPIAAVTQKHGDSFVTLKQANGTLQAQKVRTGAATANQVVIEAGLKPNDVIVYE